MRSNAEGGRDGAEWLPVMQEWPQLRDAVGAHPADLPGPRGRCASGAYHLDATLDAAAIGGVGCCGGRGWVEGAVAIVANPSTFSFLRHGLPVVLAPCCISWPQIAPCPGAW